MINRLMQVSAWMCFAAAVLLAALALRTTKAGTEVVDLIIDLLPGVSISVAVYFGVRGLEAWRAQLVGKRAFEVAEEALVSFAGARDAIEHARVPLIHEGEGSSRKTGAGETEKETQRRNANFVPIERLNEQSAKFAPLRKAQLLCRYHFGADAAAPFETLYKIRREIVTNSWLLNDLAADEAQPLDDANKKLVLNARRLIWRTGGPDDEVDKRLEEANVRLETLLQPFLR